MMMTWVLLGNVRSQEVDRSRHLTASKTRGWEGMREWPDLRHRWEAQVAGVKERAVIPDCPFEVLAKMGIYFYLHCNLYRKGNSFTSLQEILKSVTCQLI